MIAIGAGRVGTSLARRAREVGATWQVVDRAGVDAVFAAPAGTPVLCLVRAEDLAALGAQVPAHRRPDLVIVQNGMLRERLVAWGLGACTRGELYLAAGAIDGPLVAGDDSVFSGEHAQAVVDGFARLGLPARAVAPFQFAYYELEKTIWLSVFGALCERHGARVGEVATAHREELAAVTAELLRVGRHVYGVDAPVDYVVERLVRYAGSIADWPAAVRDWPYRSGWFVAAARSRAIATPAHDALLGAIGRLDA